MNRTQLFLAAKIELLQDQGYVGDACAADWEKLFTTRHLEPITYVEYDLPAFLQVAERERLFLRVRAKFDTLMAAHFDLNTEKEEYRQLAGDLSLRKKNEYFQAKGYIKSGEHYKLENARNGVYAPDLAAAIIAEYNNISTQCRQEYYRIVALIDAATTEDEIKTAYLGANFPRFS